MPHPELEAEFRDVTGARTVRMGEARVDRSTTAVLDRQDDPVRAANAAAYRRRLEQGLDPLTGRPLNAVELEEVQGSPDHPRRGPVADRAAEAARRQGLAEGKDLGLLDAADRPFFDRWLTGEPIAQIARRLHVTDTQAFKRLKRARERLGIVTPFGHRGGQAAGTHHGDTEDTEDTEDGDA